MPSTEELELWSKYEKEIVQFVSMRQMDDEILFQAIASCSGLITACARNVKCFAEQGMLIATEDSITELQKVTNNLSSMVREAKERAKRNG